MAANTSTPSSSREASIDPRFHSLLEAAKSGNFRSLHQDLRDQGLLLGTTPQGNTCLHIASIYDRKDFCNNVLELDQSLPLLSKINVEGMTPLLTAVTCGNETLSSSILKRCCDHQLSEAILTQDKQQCNALHHAIRNEFKKLALDLIEAKPKLSEAKNKYNESPMFIAVMKSYRDIFEKLLAIPGSAHDGAYGYNVLHAAVRSGNPDTIKRILESGRSSFSSLAEEENEEKATPVYLAVRWGKTDILKVLLEHDWRLGYKASARNGIPALITAGYHGHVGVARELLKHCPDAPYCKKNGTTCLHDAVCRGHIEFVKFVLASKELQKVINMRDEHGKTPLHYAVQKCNPRIVATLLHHNSIDITMLSKNDWVATWQLYDCRDRGKTLNWNDVSMLMMKADSQNEPSIRNLRESIRNNLTEASRKEANKLTQIYTGNTSLVAILIATITFAAAFTLPGGYSSNDGSQGVPIMARNLAFQAFLVSDTLAMCASLSVAFICIIARWEDLEFLLHYRSITQKLMWFAYMATTTAFATGLYTVLAPRVMWLAVTVCCLPVILPILTKLFGEWPVLKLKLKLRGNFKHELLDMV